MAQTNEIAEAEKYLSTYIQNLKGQPDRERDASQALMILAQIAEDRNDTTAAMAWLDMVATTAQNGATNAALKRAQLMAKSGKLDDARFLQAKFARELGNRLAGLIRRYRADIGRGEVGE